LTGRSSKQFLDDGSFNQFKLTYKGKQYVYFYKTCEDGSRPITSFESFDFLKVPPAEDVRGVPKIVAITPIFFNKHKDEFLQCLGLQRIADIEFVKIKPDGSKEWWPRTQRLKPGESCANNFLMILTKK
jgi:hypothetical protein